jgi:VanZ family protein
MKRRDEALAPPIDPSASETRRSARWLELLLHCLFCAGIMAIIFISLLPANWVPPLMNDRLEHLVAYAYLGLIGGLIFPRLRATLRLILFLWILAAMLEIAQKFAPGRSTEVADAVFGAMGACLALLPRLVAYLIKPDKC